MNTSMFAFYSILHAFSYMVFANLLRVRHVTDSNTKISKPLDTLLKEITKMSPRLFLYIWFTNLQDLTKKVFFLST